MFSSNKTLHADANSVGERLRDDALEIQRSREKLVNYCRASSSIVPLSGFLLLRFGCP